MSSKKTIVILTGAGISKESGLSTFRDEDGLWAKHKIEDVCTPEALEMNPEFVNNFYNLRRREIQEESVQENAAHLALAHLEKEHDGEVWIITQNIDNLHEKAGSEKIIHIHGELLQVRCQMCEEDFKWNQDVLPESTCPKCNEAGELRPHVVFFGEMPIDMEKCYHLLETCDIFISIGTSGNVYPAAGFVQIAKNAGAKTVELNLEESSGSSFFHEQIHGKATVVVPEYVEKLLNA